MVIPKKYSPEELTCKVCGKLSKSPLGAKKHYETKHTKEGAEKMRRAAIKGAKLRKANLLINSQEEIIAPTKRPYIRRTKSIETVENICVKFCPNCGCNIQAVGIALNFKS